MESPVPFGAIASTSMADETNFKTALQFVKPECVLDSLKRILDFLKSPARELCYVNISPHQLEFYYKLFDNESNLNSAGFTDECKVIAKDILDALAENTLNYEFEATFEPGCLEDSTLIFKKHFLYKNLNTDHGELVTVPTFKFKDKWMKRTLTFIKSTQMVLRYDPDLVKSEIDYLYNILWRHNDDEFLTLDYNKTCNSLFEAMSILGLRYEYIISVCVQPDWTECLVFEKIRKRNRQLVTKGSPEETPNPEGDQPKPTTSNMFEKVSPEFIKESLRKILEFITDDATLSFEISNLSDEESELLLKIRKIIPNLLRNKLVFDEACNELLKQVVALYAEKKTAFKLKATSVKTKKPETKQGNLSMQDQVGNLEYESCVMFLKVPRSSTPATPDPSKMLLQVLEQPLHQGRHVLSASEILLSSIENSPSRTKKVKRSAKSMNGSKEDLTITNTLVLPSALTRSAPQLNLKLMAAIGKKRKAKKSRGKVSPNLHSPAKERVTDLYTPAIYSQIQSPTRVAPKMRDMKTKLIEGLSAPIESDKAIRMMRLMGWKGGALGLRGNGLIEPIMPAYDLKVRVGLGHPSQKLYTGATSMNRFPAISPYYPRPPVTDVEQKKVTVNVPISNKQETNDMADSGMKESNDVADSGIKDTHDAGDFEMKETNVVANCEIKETKDLADSRMEEANDVADSEIKETSDVSDCEKKETNDIVDCEMKKTNDVADFEMKETNDNITVSNATWTIEAEAEMVTEDVLVEPNSSDVQDPVDVNKPSNQLETESQTSNNNTYEVVESENNLIIESTVTKDKEAETLEIIDKEVEVATNGTKEQRVCEVNTMDSKDANNIVMNAKLKRIIDSINNKDITGRFRDAADRIEFLILVLDLLQSELKFVAKIRYRQDKTKAFIEIAIAYINKREKPDVPTHREMSLVNNIICIMKKVPTLVLEIEITNGSVKVTKIDSSQPPVHLLGNIRLLAPTRHLFTAYRKSDIFLILDSSQQKILIYEVLLSFIQSNESDREIQFKAPMNTRLRWNIEDLITCINLQQTPIGIESSLIERLMWYEVVPATLNIYLIVNFSRGGRGFNVLSFSKVRVTYRPCVCRDLDIFNNSLSRYCTHRPRPYSQFILHLEDYKQKEEGGDAQEKTVCFVRARSPYLKLGNEQCGFKDVDSNVNVNATSDDIKESDNVEELFDSKVPISVKDISIASDVEPCEDGKEPRDNEDKVSNSDETISGLDDSEIDFSTDSNSSGMQQIIKEMQTNQDTEFGNTENNTCNVYTSWLERKKLKKSLKKAENTSTMKDKCGSTGTEEAKDVRGNETDDNKGGEVSETDNTCDNTYNNNQDSSAQDEDMSNNNLQMTDKDIRFDVIDILNKKTERSTTVDNSNENYEDNNNTIAQIPDKNDPLDDNKDKINEKDNIKTGLMEQEETFDETTEQIKYNLETSDRDRVLEKGEKENELHLVKKDENAIGTSNEIWPRNISIVPINYPENAMDANAAKKLQMELYDSVAIKDMPLLKCHGIKDGGLVYACQNEKSYIWLKEKLGENYKIVTFECGFNKTHIIVMKLNSFIPVDSKVILQNIGALYEEINTDSWRVIEDTFSGEFSTVTLEVDDSSYVSIKKEGFSLYVGFDKAEISVLHTNK